MNQQREAAIALIGLLVFFALFITLPPWQEWFNTWANALAYQMGYR